MRMQRRNGILLWLFAVGLGMALHAPIAGAVNTIYRNAVIYGTGASSCSAALGQSCTGLNVTYWNSGDHRAHVHSSDGTEYAIPQTAVASGGGYSTFAYNGTPLTQQTIANLVGSSVACNNNGTSSRTDCVFKPQGWINVKDYGATGDGATDDTTAIQSAIQAAQSVGGQYVVEPPGTYVITSTLTVGQNGVHIVGSGINATTMKFAPASHSVAFTVGTGGALGTMTMTYAVDGGSSTSVGSTAA
ncbi:MAG TPA: glycosyl hydrolase family 28-related protein, partial [Polyangia bacterium]|nr:glycosyl hydrolase family 28-related protein [Polyangia bacterium]